MTHLWMKARTGIPVIDLLARCIILSSHPYPFDAEFSGEHAL